MLIMKENNQRLFLHPRDENTEIMPKCQGCFFSRQLLDSFDNILFVTGTNGILSIIGITQRLAEHLTMNSANRTSAISIKHGVTSDGHRHF
mmetsp:Transcript_1272/g.1829  ORF Transcript_1272/g.1829 Transcript_1272/m.1829 type:complete len:91 (-) Transcript_1272:694-966(-)